VTETNSTLTTSGTLTTTDADLTNTVAATVQSMAITGGTFNAASVPLTNAELKSMLTLQAAGGPSVGTSDGTGITNLDNQQGLLYINTAASGMTGTVSQWRLFKPAGSGSSFYTGSWVTPVIFEKVGSNFIVRGVGRSRLTTTAGTYTFDFDVVSGSNQLLNGNYTYGHFDRNVNGSSGTLDTRSTGSVGWAGSGGDWTFRWNSELPANPMGIGTSHNNVGSGGRLYASELILDALAALPANPPSGSDVTWNFASGAGGSAAFNFLAAGETLQLTYTVRVSDSNSPTGTADLPITVTVTGSNDGPTISLGSGNSDAATVVETDAGLTASGTLSVEDVDVTNTVSVAVQSVVAGGTTVGLGSDNAALLAMLSVNAGNVISNSTTTGTINWAFGSGSEAFDYLAAGESLTLTYTVRATDSATPAAFADKTVTITVTGTQDLPRISIGSGDSIADSLTETDAGLTTSGTLSVEDLDRTNTVTVAVDSVVAGGTTTGLNSSNAALLAMLTVNSPNTVIPGTTTTGTIAWAFNSGLEAFAYLSIGQSLTLTYTLRVTDSNSPAGTADQTVTLTIIGTNDTPVVSAAATGLNPTHTSYRGAASTVFGGSPSFSMVEVADRVRRLVITVTNVADGSAESLLIRGTSVPLVAGSIPFTGGTATVAVASGTATVTLDFPTTITPSAAATLLTGIDYGNTKPAATVGPRIVTLTAIADDGGSSTDTLTGTLSTSTVTVVRETVPPTITGVAVPPDGFYKQGEYLVFTVTLTEDVIVTGSPTIDITIGSVIRKLAYVPAESVPGATPATLVFTYLLVPGDVDNDGVTLGGQIDVNGGSITDLAENPGILTLVNVPSTAGVKVNLPPVGFDDTGISVEAGGVANSAGGSTATGNLVTNDNDNENDPITVTAIRLGVVEGSGTAGTLGQPLAGSYGSLTVLADGSFTYAIDETNPAVEALRPGDTLTDSFNYTLTDGSSLDTAALVITLRGTNDTPAITPVTIAYTDTIAADAFTRTTGTLAAVDPDLAAVRTWGIQGVQPVLGIATLQGLYGTLSVNVATGAYVYLPDPLRINPITADASDVFTVTADDGLAVGVAPFTVNLTAAVDTPTVQNVSEDTGASVTDRITNNPVLTVTGIADPGATVKLLDRGPDGNGPSVVVGTAVASPSGSFSLTSQPLAEGVHRLSLVSERGSLTSGTVALGDWTIDLTPPAVPVVTTSGTSGGLVAGTAEPGSRVTVSFAAAGTYPGGTYVTTADPSGAWSIDVASEPPVAGRAVPLPGGPFTTTATATDVAGNPSAPSAGRPIAFDGSAPRITSPDVTAELRPTLFGTAPASRSLRVFIDGVLVGTTTSTAAGTWSFVPPTDLALGIRAVRVAVLINGVERGATTQDLLVDRSAPAAPAFTTPVLVRTATPPITGTGPAGTMLTLSIRRAGQAPTTVYRTTVAADGTWRVPVGGLIPTSGVLTSLPDGDYDLEAVATSATGFTSPIATHRLTVDTAAPLAPVFTSPTLTSDTTPVITGTAEPGSLLRLTIENALFETSVAGDGSWAIDIETAVTTTGTRITLPETIHDLRAVSLDAAGNESPRAMQLLRVVGSTVGEAPAVLALTASFGGILSADETLAAARVTVIFAGIEDGRSATLSLAGTDVTTTVAQGSAVFSVPAAALAALPQGTAAFAVAATNEAGTPTPDFTSPFLVDTLGPARPTFVSITSTIHDPTPGDRFTALVQPTVVITGEPGQTPVIRGPEGVVDPARYQVTEAPAGRYTIVFLDPQVQGDYVVNLRDASGNESSNGVGSAAQNFFRIDSVPILYDMTARRQVIANRVYGNLGALNNLDGGEFPVVQNADGTWTDLDGERLTMGIVGGLARTADGRVVEMTTSVNGATLSVLTDTGAYTYTPVAGTARLDRFPLFLRDESGNETQFTLSFDSRDYLDRDGIGSVTESRLSGAGGDRNRDGIRDEQQNSVTTLAWGTQSDFATAVNPATVGNVNRSTVSTIVVNATPFQGPGGRNFSSLAALLTDVDPLSQLLDIGVQSPRTLTALNPNSGDFTRGSWDTMQYAVESLTSSGLTDLMAWRPGKQIQVSIDVSAAGILTRGGANGAVGLNAARKFVSASTIEAYAAAGLPLRGLDGTVVTAPGWHDFTARDTNADGIYDTDGAIFVDFQQPGQRGYGVVDAIVIVITDNAFGDDDPTLERIVDPVLPGAANIAPAVAAAAVSYVNTTAFDTFPVSAGQVVAADADGDRLTYGIAGGRVQGRFSTLASPLGTLRVNRTTGGYTFTPARAAMNAIATTTFQDFVLTISDGKLSSHSNFRVTVAPASLTALDADFLLGSQVPDTAANVITPLPILTPGVIGPTVPVRQQYIQFTIRGALADIRLSDLQFYSNDRLISLRTTRLVKVAEANGSATYRLLGIRHISSAKARYTFVIGGAAGGVATTWYRV
jgi:VCBS repeat-containing protein